MVKSVLGYFIAATLLVACSTQNGVEPTPLELQSQGAPAFGMKNCADWKAQIVAGTCKEKCAADYYKSNCETTGKIQSYPASGIPSAE